MTVCIAAICENGNSIVLASDRLRWHPTAAIEAEIDEPKFYFLSDQLVLMGSGNSSSIEEVMRRVRAMPADSGLTTVEASARFLEACQDTRTRQIEALCSKRLLGLKFADFKATLASANPGSIALDFYNRTLTHEFGTILIVAGLDRDGAHLHVVDDSTDTSNSEAGYTAIGSGNTLANVSLARRKHKKSSALPVALYNVYEAKRTAELARGVGAATDISVIRNGLAPINITPGTIAALQAAYERLAPPSISPADTDAIASALANQAG